MKTPRGVWDRLFLFAVLFLAAAMSVWAQSDAARLQGLVSDPSGAVMPGAQVKVTEVATNRTLEVQTDEGGSYSFPALPPGDYSISITIAGFQTTTQKVTLQVAQVANVNFTLQPGQVSEEVTVSASAAIVDSVTSDMGTTVQTKQIEDLPLNGRNFTELATLIPGVNRGVPGNNATGAGNNAETFRYSNTGGAALDVNGARPQANNFMLDGVDNNESLVNTIVFFPPADAIQEFKVQTNMAPAEFGRAGGGIVNATIKSGTNQFHGDAFDYLRNSYLDARPTFAPTKTPFRRNQFGGTLGGPIKKNKIFIFGDYQGLRQSEPIEQYYASVPTSLMRQGNFSELLNPAGSGLGAPITITDPATGLAFPGNVIPGNLQNPVGLKYLNAFPLPNVAGRVEQNYYVERNQVQNFDDYDIRGDWMASERDQVFMRFSYAHDPEITASRFPALPAGFGSGTQFTYADGAGAGYTHTFSPTLLSDLRLGYQRTYLGYAPPFQSEALAANLGIPNANTSPLLGGGALIGGYNSQLEYTGDYGPYLVPENTYQLAETLSYVKGSHTFKFGANLIRRNVNLFRPIAGKGYFFLFGNGQGPGSTGYEVSDLLAGFVNNYQIGPPFGMVGTWTWENGLFAQDDWRVSRKLTLNLGLRWDYLSNPTEEHGRQANFSIPTDSIVLAQGGGDPLVKNNYHNFGPRIGLAYDLTGSGKTVIRSGYGIFYFVDRGGISNQLAQNAPFSGVSQYNYSNGYRITLSGACPVGSGNTATVEAVDCTGALPLGNSFAGLSLTHPQNVSLTAILPDNKTPMMEQWNVQVQHELMNNTLVSVAYVGAAGHHLIDYYNLNNQLYNTPSGTVLYPGMGSINVASAGGNSIYNALQAELSRRYSNGLQFTASYTFSRTIDNGGGAFGNSAYADFMNLNLDRGLADQDIRNRFVLSAVYELPFGRGRHWGNGVNRAVDTVLGGWQLNGILQIQSGLPFSIGDPASPGGRVDLIGDLWTQPGNTQQYFNTAAVAAVPTNSTGVEIRPGTLGRNVLIGPGIKTVDLSLFKDFSIIERAKLEFRAEAFNIANHPQYAQPNTDITNHALFGVINSTLLGSERQLQFAAKLIF